MASTSIEEDRPFSRDFVTRNARTSKDNSMKGEEIKHVLTGEAFTNFEDVAMIKVIHPIYISMRIFGLHWQIKKKMFNGKWCTFDCATVHCCLVLFSAWFFAIRHFAAYEQSDTYGSKLFRKLFLHLANIQIASGITANVYYKQKRIQPFILLWENYKIKYGGVPFGQLKRNIIMRLIPKNVLVILCCILSTTTILLLDPQLVATYHFQFLSKRDIDDVPVWLTVLFCVWDAYITMAWFQSFLVCLCLNKNLSQEFRQLSTGFSEDMHALRRVPSRLRKFGSHNNQARVAHENKNQTEYYRQRHLELCKLVKAYDDVISSYLLFIYLFSIPLIILLIYALFGFDSDRPHDSKSLFMLPITTLIFYIYVVVSITTSSSSINAAVSCFYFFTCRSLESYWCQALRNVSHRTFV